VEVYITPPIRLHGVMLS